MTDNQFQQMMNLMNKSVSSSQETTKIVKSLEKKVEKIEKDVAELKEGQERLESNVSELKEGQKRIEKEMRQTIRAFNELAGETMRVKLRVDDLEQQELSN